MIKKIKKIVKKKKEPKYIIKLSPQVWEKLPELTKKQIAELLARLKQAEEERDEYKRKLEELKGKAKPEEVKVLEEAVAKQIKLEKEKELRRVVLVPYTIKNNELKPLKIRFLPYGGGIVRGAKGVYKYFAGWELEESENGLATFVNILLKNKPKSKRVVRLKANPSLDLNLLTVPYLVRKILSGIYEAPVTKDGKTMPIEQKLKRNMQKIVESYKKEISELQQKLEEVMARNYELAKINENLAIENKKLKNDLLIANYRADMAVALQQDQTKKVQGMLRDYATILSDAMHAQVNEMLQRRLSWLLAQGNKILREELEKAYGKEISDEVWEKIERRFYRTIDKIATLFPKEKQKEVEKK